jgi:hypothetical protein
MQGKSGVDSILKFLFIFAIPYSKSKGNGKRLVRSIIVPKAVFLTYEVRFFLPIF